MKPDLTITRNPRIPHGLTSPQTYNLPPITDGGCQKKKKHDIINGQKREVITLICLTKNLVYKNIEAQMRKKIRTIVRTSSASNLREFKNI